jgi:endonuclease/exonuclease/phosphatase (EEP) superfamily protein YafD
VSPAPEKLGAAAEEPGPAAGSGPLGGGFARMGVWALRVLIGGFVAWAAVRGLGLDLATPFVQLISYTPYVAGASLLPLAAALVGRRWREAAVAAAVVAAFALFVAPRVMPADQTVGPRSDTLKVLTVNTLAGGADAGRIMELIRQEKPDVLSVQELTDDAVARLDAAGIATELPHCALRPRDGVSGTGLYARYPLVDGGGLDAQSTFDMTHAVLKAPHRDIDLVSVHTSPPLPGGAVERWRRDFRLLPHADADGTLRVLAGDFNATLDHAELRALLGTGYLDAAETAGAGLVPTWPNGRTLPPVTIDHVLTDQRAGVGLVRVFDVAGSDHRAVVAELRLPR